MEPESRSTARRSQHARLRSASPFQSRSAHKFAQREKSQQAVPPQSQKNPAIILARAHNTIAMKTSIPENWPRSDDVIAYILKNYKTIAVVGLSSNPRRPSFNVTQYMQSAGYRIIPVNPNETEVLGEKSYPRLEDNPK